jgi:16S rRNA (guanine966-N2)-methyltransferase
MALRLSGGRRLRSPRGEVARPTTGRVRAAVMNMLAGELRGCRWLDLCGGSGVMACEALQRGAQEVVVVEKDRRVAAVARDNLALVAAGLSHAGGAAPTVEVLEQEALRFLGQGAAASGVGCFDLIYADPPWAAQLHRPLAEAVIGLPRGAPWCGSVPEGWPSSRQRVGGSGAGAFTVAVRWCCWRTMASLCSEARQRVCTRRTAGNPC